MGFVSHFPIKLALLAVLLAWGVVGCGDLQPETAGTATVRLRLASNTHSPALLRQASRIADNASNRATVELIPTAACSGNPGNTGSLGAVAVTLGGSPTATFTAVPLETALKLCVYLYKATTTSTTPDATGESETFIISTENYSATILVTVYETLSAKLRLQITDKYGNGPYKGTAAYYDNNSSQQGTVQSSGFPDNATTYSFPSDNNTSSYFSSDNKTYHLVIDNVSYDPRGTSLTTTITLPGFQTLQESLVISESNVVSGERAYAVQLTPEMIDSSWLSIDNLTVANDNGTRRTAEVSGYLRLNVPASKSDNISQLIATLTVKRVGGTETIITPAVNLSLADNVSSNSDNTSYCYKFCLGTDSCMSSADTSRCYGYVHQQTSSNQLSLVHGSNTIQVISTVEGTSTTLVDNATVSYDSCLDNSTMCLNLNWETAGDLDLHTYYYPSWGYTDNATATGFNGQRYRHGLQSGHAVPHQLLPAGRSEPDGHRRSLQAGSRRGQHQRRDSGNAGLGHRQRQGGEGHLPGLFRGIRQGRGQPHGPQRHPHPERPRPQRQPHLRPLQPQSRVHAVGQRPPARLRHSSRQQHHPELRDDQPAGHAGQRDLHGQHDLAGEFDVHGQQHRDAEVRLGLQHQHPLREPDALLVDVPEQLSRYDATPPLSMLPDAVGPRGPAAQTDSLQICSSDCF